MAADGALLVRASSAMRHKAQQERPTDVQARKRPAALHVLAQGLHTQGCDRPTAYRRRRARGKRLGGLEHLWAGKRLVVSGLPLPGGLAEHLTGAGHFRLHQGPSHQQGQNRGLVGQRRLATHLRQLEQLFHAFDEQFDLPPGAIEGQHLLVGLLGGR